MSLAITPRPARLVFAPRVVRGGFVLLLVLGFAGSLAVIAGDRPVDADLTRLLRAMAAIKAVMALGLVTAVLWRLGNAVTLARFVAYTVACGAAVAGPVLIWGMVFVVSGAALLHGGLIAGVLLLWRDRAVSERLTVLVAARRARLNAAR
jgi:hypothetical protein